MDVSISSSSSSSREFGLTRIESRTRRLLRADFLRRGSRGALVSAASSLGGGAGERRRRFCTCACGVVAPEVRSYGDGDVMRVRDEGRLRLLALSPRDARGVDTLSSLSLSWRSTGNAFLFVSCLGLAFTWLCCLCDGVGDCNFRFVFTRDTPVTSSASKPRREIMVRMTFSN